MALNSTSYAANLPAIDNADLQIILGTRISEYIIRQYRRELNLNLILNIDSDVDLCKTITYLCGDTTDVPNMSDSAVDAAYKRQTMAPPSVKTFSGFCKGGFETKLAMDQLECINQSEVLQEWYQSTLARAVEDGKQSIMARFYRHMIAHAHPKNTGSNAGLTYGGQQLGTQQNPVVFDQDGVDDWAMAILDTIKQMPRSTPMMNEYGQSAENGFFFGHPSMESVLMKSARYNDYDKVGDCGGCSYFSDTFTHMPRDLMPLMSSCVETYTCESGGGTMKIYPVLFGKRYMGTKAAMRVKASSYTEQSTESVIYRYSFYHHIHTYDCRFLGISWVTVADTQPRTVTGC